MTLAYKVAWRRLHEEIAKHPDHVHWSVRELKDLMLQILSEEGED